MPTPHPERPDRLRAIAQHLVATGVYQRCLTLPAREVENSELETVHGNNYIKNIDDLTKVVLQHHGGYHFDSGDTYANMYTYQAARLATGSVLQLTEAIMRGYIDRGYVIYTYMYICIYTCRCVYSNR